MLNLAGYIIVPLMICFFICSGIIKKINVYEAFTVGVCDGVKTVATIFPSLFALFIAVSVLRASGLVTFISNVMEPFCNAIRFPTELLPFALLRPVSGSGSLAMAADIFENFGPDSFSGRLASVIMASTETSFYTTSVYFGAVGTKNIRYSLKCALCADVFSVAVSALVCYLYF